MAVSIAPQLGLSSFSCPHCHALAHQDWFLAYAKEGDKGWTPTSWEPQEAEERIKKEKLDDGLVDFLRLLASPKPFRSSEGASIYAYWMPNISLSECFSCKQTAVWLKNKLIFPNNEFALEANDDLPADIKRDFEEAVSIVGNSPRGAAALLRLCIQKICVELDQPGKNLNADIAALVKLGLSKRVQQALDLVRVVGNDAVHPGTIDLRDDEATARQLFILVNLIADSMISQPAQVDRMYKNLPQEKLAQIEMRDRDRTE
ncbi:MAG: hypothetical protein ACI8U3_000477 [Brevundimonas sp.]|jgi:hypothetical protein|uniref:DUF4145 domain-containing protein n=1 Tax=Brevundimonas sp. TaxID=1871086 RepID=UPI0039E36CC2